MEYLIFVLMFIITIQIKRLKANLSQPIIYGVYLVRKVITPWTNSTPWYFYYY